MLIKCPHCNQPLEIKVELKPGIPNPVPHTPFYSQEDYEEAIKEADKDFEAKRKARWETIRKSVY